MTTLRCERVFASVLRAVGSPWRNRICLVGGLVSHYLLLQNAVGPAAGHDYAIGCIMVAAPTFFREDLWARAR